MFDLLDQNLFRTLPLLLLYRHLLPFVCEHIVQDCYLSFGCSLDLIHGFFRSLPFHFEIIHGSFQFMHLIIQKRNHFLIRCRLSGNLGGSLSILLQRRLQTLDSLREDFFDLKRPLQLCGEVVHVFVGFEEFFFFFSELVSHGYDGG